MDADSSYGGSDTAQDSTCGNENNSLENTTIISQTDTSPNNISHNSNNLVSTITVNTEENPYYNKNEITLPVNRDETDFKSENSTKLPQYLTTANLNINETLEHHSNLEAMSKQYKSTSYLNAESESPPAHRKSGLDNPCFEDGDEIKEKESVKSSFDQSKPYNGDLSPSANSSIENGEPLTEAVNLELINLKPSGKDVTGLYENGKNGMTSIPMKQDVDAEMGNPYDEYFVPVNEHKKYMSKFRRGRNSVTFAESLATSSGYDDEENGSGIMQYPEWIKSQHQRGEKLYVTMDKRNVKKKSRCLCWGVCISVVLAAVIVGILAAVGVIGTKPVQEVSSRQFSGSTPEVKTGGIFGLPPSLDTEDSSDDTSPKYTPGPPSSTVPYPLTTDMTEILVPQALESQIKIDNLEFDPEYANKKSKKFQDLASTIESQLKETIFTDEELNYGPADIEVKVIDFMEGSVIARYRIVWKFKDGLHNTKDPIDANSLEKRMAEKMRENLNYLSAFQINEEASMNKTMGVLDSCKIQNFGCEYQCSFDYQSAEFICLCPEGTILNEDGKHCDQISHSPLPEPDFEAKSKGPLESIPEINTEPEPHSEPEPISKVHSETTLEPDLFPIPSSEPEPQVNSKLEGEPTSQPQSEPNIQHEFMSEPTAEPNAEPTPEPHAEPSSEHQMEPKSEPQAEPTSEPHAEPTSEPHAEPTSEPHAEPTSEPHVESTSEPRAEPTSEPHAESNSKPSVEPHTIRILEPQSEPNAEPTSKPDIEPTSEPLAEPTSESGLQPTAEPTSEPHTEQFSEPHAEPTSEPQAEPTSEPQAKPITETHLEATKIPENEAISKLFVEDTSEPQAEQTSEPLVEQTVEPQTEPTSEPHAEPTAEPNNNSSPEPILKSVAEVTKISYGLPTDENLQLTTETKHESDQGITPENEFITFKPPSEPQTAPINSEGSSESITEQVMQAEVENELSIPIQTKATNTMSTESPDNLSIFQHAGNHSMEELKKEAEYTTESMSPENQSFAANSEPADAPQLQKSPLPETTSEAESEVKQTSKPDFTTQNLPAFMSETPMVNAGKNVTDILAAEKNISTEGQDQQSSNEISTSPTILSNTQKTAEELETITIAQITTIMPSIMSSSQQEFSELDNAITTMKNDNYSKIIPSGTTASSSAQQVDLVTINPQLFKQNLTEEISTETPKITENVFNETTEVVKMEKIIDQSENSATTEKMLKITDQFTTSRHVEELTESTNKKIADTHQDILMNEPNEYPNNLEIMSPFLPEIENDTFINSLRSDDHFVDHIMPSNLESSEEYSLTTKPPRLDNDQLNKTNPLDPNPTDAISIDQENFIKENVDTQSSPSSMESVGTNRSDNVRMGKENHNLTDNGTLFEIPKETEYKKEEESPSSTEPIAPEILNNVHSNSFFDKMDELMETTQKPSDISETTLGITNLGDIVSGTTNSEFVSKSEEATQAIDGFTISSAEMNSAEQDSMTSATNNNDKNDISSSTEDLIAMETTTYGLKVPPGNDLKKKKSKSIEYLNKEADPEQNTASIAENTEQPKSDLNNELDKNVQSYAVQETIIDSTTTTKLFVTKPTSTAIPVLQEEEVKESTNNYSETTSSFNDIFNEDVLNKSRKMQETTSEALEITTHVFTDNETEEVSRDQYFGKKLRLDEPLLTTVNEIVTRSETDVKPVTEGFRIMGFSRCNTDQFQCVSGTSVSTGSYCIPISDRCDSSSDCSDGSDEINCQKEECLNNFQCASGQCLKRHLVCDGIMNCNDNSDEVNCESWNCTLTEFACGKNDRCIPDNWKCDGRSHCRDGSDENDCNANECQKNHFRCSERGACIPNAWKCDGKTDCSNAEDERECGCTAEEFKCQMGGGCIKLKQVCDGVSDCGDKSDEWNCLTLQQTTSILEAHLKNETAFICSTNWNTTYSDTVCETMGYDSATQYKEVAKPSEATKLLKIKSDAIYGSSILMSLEEVSSCEKIVTVECQRNACGIKSDAIPIEKEFNNQTYNLPSLSLLYNNKQNVYCSASLIAQSWVISAYSCILGSLNGLDMSPNDWVVKIGGQQRMVADVIEYPKVKYSNFYYNNDVVLIKLDRPVTSTTNVSALCIPKDFVKDKQSCVTAGWKNIIPGDAAKKQYLNHLAMPLISIQECNSTKHYNGMMSQGEICVESNEADNFPCYNDVGAPLICLSEETKMWELQGLLTHSNNCKAIRHPLVYTSINRDLITWIENTIGQAASARSV